MVQPLKTKLRLIYTLSTVKIEVCPPCSAQPFPLMNVPLPSYVPKEFGKLNAARVGFCRSLLDPKGQKKVIRSGFQSYEGVTYLVLWLSHF